MGFIIDEFGLGPYDQRILPRVEAEVIMRNPDLTPPVAAVTFAE